MGGERGLQAVTQACNSDALEDIFKSLEQGGVLASGRTDAGGGVFVQAPPGVVAAVAESVALSVAAAHTTP